MAPQLAGSHILDHTLAQRADGGISAHGELLLSEVANTSSCSGRGSPPRYNRALNSLPTRQRAPRRSGYRGSDLAQCSLVVRLSVGPNGGSPAISADLWWPPLGPVWAM